MKIGRILTLWLDVDRLRQYPLSADLTRTNVLRAMMLEPWITWAVNALGGTASFQEVYEFLDDAEDIPMYLAVDSLLFKGKLVSQDGGGGWYSDNPPAHHRTQVLTTTGTKKAIDVVDAPESVYRRLNIMMPPRRE